LEGARGGSAEALGELLEDCRAYLQAVAAEVLPAELRPKVSESDLVQETFLEARRDFHGFQGATEAELLGWLRVILLHNLANQRRRFQGTGKRLASREVPLDADESGPHVQQLVDDGPSPSSAARANERDEALERALAQLSDDQREAIVRHTRDKQTFAQIGAALGRSPEAARKLWTRALERLQHILETGP
jgi:RNA polymerase sigma-70 factor (ECF subfamily)